MQDIATHHIWSAPALLSILLIVNAITVLYYIYFWRFQINFIIFVINNIHVYE